MSKYITPEDLNTALGKQTEEIIDVLQTYMHRVDDRFNKIEKDISDIKKKY